MRQGMSPEAALMKVMERVIAMTEKRLLNDNGRPYFELQFYAVNKEGDYAGATAYEGGHFAVADERGARLENSAFLFRRSERPTRPMTGSVARRDRSRPFFVPGPTEVRPEILDAMSASDASSIAARRCRSSCSA